VSARSAHRQALEAALRDLGPHVAYPERAPSPVGVLDLPGRLGPRRRHTAARVAIAVAALSIAAASFAFLWSSFRPAPDPRPTPAIPAGWTEVRREGASLLLPPGSQAVDRPGAWIAALREAGLPRHDVRGWRETPNAFVFAVTLPDGGSMLLWHPRPTARFNGWTTARVLAGVATASARTDRGASTVDGREAISLTFAMPDGSTHIGYRVIAAGDTWNLSFVAHGPDAGRQFATFARVVETLTIASSNDGR
jgi:hypothetical protein